MKVLWFSNAVLTSDQTKSTGTWLHSMSKALTERGIELFNITQNSSVKDIKVITDGNIKQWVLPVYRLRNGLPHRDTIKKICSVVEKISPDIIHIWGMECYWGLLFSRGYIKGNVLLEIQGIKETCARVFYGGLSFKDRLKTIGIREILRPSLSLMMLKREFALWSKYEREMLTTHTNISTHSDWVRAWISQFTKSDCQIFHTQRIVRKEFLLANVWVKPHHNIDSPVIFSMSSGPDAYKGIHDAINAVFVLKKSFPNVKLLIAGDYGVEKSVIRKPGYTKYLQSLIRKNDVKENVVFLGPLNASQIIDYIHQSDVMLQTSYVESYSLAVSEAMMAGVPLVVSFAGAMPELAKDKETALFYTPSDYFACAYLLKRVIESNELSEHLSKTSRHIAENRNIASLLGDLQINIYNKILAK